MQHSFHSALVAYTGRSEGLLWQAILKLQGLDVVLKPELTNIYEYLKRNTPDILLININANSNNSLISGSVCRWCQNNLRQLKIFVINPYRSEVSDLERRWAIRRGAIDVLPQLNSLNAIDSISKVLNTIDERPHEEVIPTILSLIEKYNPTPAQEPLPLESTAAKQESNSTPETKTEGEFMIYRGVKVPRFSVASAKHRRLIYRGLPVKLDKND
ncbi:MAG: hypothetical protein LDL47_06300 [Cyanobacteria bacterium KgW148]|nr:hypothetical protein [Cyanobacteria bacterium KgW148]